MNSALILLILWGIAGFINFINCIKGYEPDWTSYWCVYIVLMAFLIKNYMN